MSVWDREGCLKETPKQLEDKDIFKELEFDPCILINTIMGALEKIRTRGDLSYGTINDLLV